MKKIILITFILISSIFLTSCGELTQKEITEAKKYCESAGKYFTLEQMPLLLGGDTYSCHLIEKEDNVFNCIQEYTNGLDEKYNNPDTVSDLREENYSQVVKVCNEVFGENDKSITK